MLIEYMLYASFIWLIKGIQWIIAIIKFEEKLLNFKGVLNELIREQQAARMLQSENLRLEKEKRGSSTWTFVLSAGPTDQRKEGRE